MRDSYTTTPRLLYVATQLFAKQGFASTSVDQICRTTGVSKGAFFHYYRSKDEIAEAALRNFWDLLDDYLFSGLEYFNAKGRLDRVLERFSDMPDHLHFQSGSLLAVIAHEVTEDQAAIRAELARTYSAWTDKLAALMHSPIRSEELCRKLARQWISVYEGAVAQSKATGERNIVREQLGLFAELSLLK